VNKASNKIVHIVPVGSGDPINSYLIPFNNYSPSKIIFLLGSDKTRPDEIKAREITKEICTKIPERIE